MIRPLLIGIFTLAAGATTAAPLETVLVSTNRAARTAGDVPTWNGTNWVTSASGGGMSKLVYDANDDDVVDDSERLGGVLASGYATTGAVAAAIAGVHAPVTLAPWSVGTLAGQRFGISSTNVVDAIAGLEISPSRVVSTRLSGGNSDLNLFAGSGDIHLYPADQDTPDPATAGGLVTIHGALKVTEAITGSVNATNLVGTISAARLPQFTGGDVTTSASGSVSLILSLATVTRAHTTITGTPDGSTPRNPEPYFSPKFTPATLNAPAPGWPNSGKVDDSCDCSQYQRRECMTAMFAPGSWLTRAASTAATPASSFGYSSAAVGEASVYAIDVATLVRPLVAWFSSVLSRLVP